MDATLADDTLWMPANEHAAAFEASRREMELRDPDIDAALADGKVVVVVTRTAHCPTTDAIIGTREGLSSVHSTRKDADAAADDISEMIGDDWDTGVVVLPRVPHEPVSLPEIADNNVPF